MQKNKNIKNLTFIKIELFVAKYTFILYNSAKVLKRIVMLVMQPTIILSKKSKIKVKT